MEINKKKPTLRLVAIVLVMALAFALANSDLDYMSTSRSIQNAGSRFSDVPTTHWAYSDIEALATGGLVNGMGDGKFSPDTTFTIAQMAQIISNAQGIDTTVESSELWYKKAVQHCLDIGCLPNFGAITGANYDVACSRELAVYMLVEGLGVPGDKTPKNYEADYIPDFGSVDMAYRDAVLKAYQYQLLTGIDDAHMFAPKNSLRRSEACALLNRAGYTTAAPKAGSSEGKTLTTIIDEFKALGVFGDASPGLGMIDYQATERKYAKLTFQYPEETKPGDEPKALTIYANEIVEEYRYDKNGNSLDEYGNVYDSSGYKFLYDSNGKYVAPSGLSYNTRQLVKQMFQIAFPTGGDELYDVFMDTITPPHLYEAGTSSPSFVRWVDGHCVVGYFNKGFTVDIYSLGNKEVYERFASKPKTTETPYRYVVTGGGVTAEHPFISIVEAYELNKR